MARILPNKTPSPTDLALWEKVGDQIDQLIDDGLFDLDFGLAAKVLRDLYCDLHGIERVHHCLTQHPKRTSHRGVRQPSRAESGTSSSVHRAMRIETGMSNANAPTLFMKADRSEIRPVTAAS